ncbi:MAG: glycosyltransferase [Planctomycetia bacterium]|nr:glycosyltransferase [Planctomycetia bacterium]
MRVLLTSHRPLRDGVAGQRLSWLCEKLSASHEVRIVQAGLTRDTPADVRVVVCNADDPCADLPFDLPSLDHDRAGLPTFHSLSNSELAAYREAFRNALDAEIDAFDPDVVHVQHLWIDGHLILESGAPYVVSAYQTEWTAAQADRRFRRFVRETAENASRVLTDDLTLRGQLAKRFELPRERFSDAALTVEQLTALYREVHECRFGRR